MLHLSFLVAGFILLMVSAYGLLEATLSLGRRLRISEIAVGAILPLALMAPKVVTTIYAQNQGQGDLALANIVGANIFIVLGGMGLMALFTRIQFDEQVKYLELPAMVFSFFLVSFFAADKQITFMESLISVAFFLVFVKAATDTGRFQQLSWPRQGVLKLSTLSASGLLVGAVLGLMLGAYLIINNLMRLNFFDLSPRLWGLTFLAVGTSLPDLVVAAMAVAKRKSSVAFTHMVGANITNILAVTGISGLAGPLKFSAALTQVDMMWMIVIGLSLITVVLSNIGLKKSVGCLYLTTLMAYCFYITY